MGIFSRKNTDSQSSAPADPEMARLGRDYAIAKRHGDRQAMKRIASEIGSRDLSDTDVDSYRQGRDAYNNVPPAHSKPRRNQRR
ncbi:hypothetical protein IPZ68_01710 [Streptomyces arenae]|nr:hypothetical protein [Streptomyces arenae]